MSIETMEIKLAEAESRGLPNSRVAVTVVFIMSESPKVNPGTGWCRNGSLRKVLILSRVLSIFGILFFTASLAVGALPDAAWLNGIPLDKAIRIGSGSHVVIEVSDPDCRFSRRMSLYWSMRKDVTRFIFLVAMKNHPDAPQKARYILAASDQARAYNEVFSGELDFDEKRLDLHYDDRGLLELHRAVAAKLGAIGTPTYVVDGVLISGAKIKEIENVLGGERIPFDTRDTD